jgi:hypothetical protein
MSADNRTETQTEAPVGTPPAAENNVAETPIVPPGTGWFQRLSSVLFIIFCFELGLFLLVYPWTDGWTDNYFAWALPGSMMSPWHAFWANRYIRGCISGLGIVNLWIAIAEVFRLFSRPSTAVKP